MTPAPAQQAILFALRPTIREAFEVFHRDNPQVYVELVKLARGEAAQGRRVGIRHLWEVMRHRMNQRTKSRDGFKLNDHHTPHYARRIMEQERDLEGYFELRRCTSED